MMSLGLIKFFVDDKLSELRGLELIQGDTLKFLVRIPVNIVPQTVSAVRFIALDASSPDQSMQTIGPKDFVGTLNEAIATTDFLLTLNPIDTESLILDSTLGALLNLHPTDAKWYQPAKKLYLEIQLTALGINKSWQGDIIIKGDLFKENSSEALPGAQKFILTLSP
jgi:hypothetical protein